MGMAGVKKVYQDVVGNNPWMGDYKLSRQGEFEEVSGSVYKMKWTGHGETTKGFLRRVSPVETNVVASVNVRNMKVDAIVWKSLAGKKYGFTLALARAVPLSFSISLPLSLSFSLSLTLSLSLSL